MFLEICCVNVGIKRLFYIVVGVLSPCTAHCRPQGGTINHWLRWLLHFHLLPRHHSGDFCCSVVSISSSHQQHFNIYSTWTNPIKLCIRVSSAAQWVPSVTNATTSTPTCPSPSWWLRSYCSSALASTRARWEKDCDDGDKMSKGCDGDEKNHKALMHEEKKATEVLP